MTLNLYIGHLFIGAEKAKYWGGIKVQINFYGLEYYRQELNRKPGKDIAESTPEPKIR